MRAAGSINVSRECAPLVFVVLVFFVSASYSTKFSSSLTASGTKSTNNDALTSSRHKRAPGWGKRAPGWGKRQNLNDELFDDFDSADDISNTVEVYWPNAFVSDDSLSKDNTDDGFSKRAPGWGKRFSSEDSYPSMLASDWDNSVPRWVKRSVNTEQVDELAEIDKKAPGWGKRAPGWGKRAPGWGKRAPGWGKRAPGWGKRAPGWGKRTVGWGKRAPGWGKRAPGWGKRAPGWGKRAPGWGKRNYQTELDSDGTETVTDYETWVNKHTADEELLENLDSAQDITRGNEALKTAGLMSEEAFLTEKRAPGWGKRAPGWGKRNYMVELDTSPGWGKHAPGWGKRAAGWGKRDYEIPLEITEADKRAPGWGKRTSTRVRRAAGHISHPSQDICQELQCTENELLARIKQLAEQHSFRGGNMKVVNKPSRK